MSLSADFTLIAVLLLHQSPAGTAPAHAAPWSADVVQLTPRQRQLYAGRAALRAAVKPPRPAVAAVLCCAANPPAGGGLQSGQSEAATTEQRPQQQDM